MDARRKTLAAMDKWAAHEFLHGEVPLSSLNLRVAKNLPPEFIANQKKKAGDGGGGPPPDFSPTKRKIPSNHKFDPKALKPLSRMLWAMSVSLGHALTAYRQFTRLKSVTVSPDGLVGGQGYVMSVKDVRAKLYEACEALSSISDTVHDEINASHWRPKLGELEKKELDEVKKLLGEAEQNLEDPEAEAEEEMEEVEDKKSWHKPSRFDEKNEKEPHSQTPGGGSKETTPSQGSNPASTHRPELTKNASWKMRTGNSSVNPSTLSGPRVDHLDRGEQPGPYGSENQDEPLVGDPWGETEGVGNEYAYPSDWENDFSKSAVVPTELLAESGLPNDKDTRTEGYDFGIGYGKGNDAHGQGAGGYGESNPSSGSYGVYGPRADLPQDPGGKLHDDTSDPTLGIDPHLDGRDKWAAGDLPGDGDDPVARSDYYADLKGNSFNGVIRGETKMPGEGMPAKDTPTRARPFSLQEHMFSADDVSELPGDESESDYNYDKDLPNVGYKYERSQPYVKWDDDTHNMRQDPIFQRGPVEGPYVK